MTHKGEKSDHHRPDLLDEFKYPTSEEWRKVADSLLKGKSYDKIMPTETYEGITLKPIYDQSDMKTLAHPDSFPGYAPFVRGTRASGYRGKAWHIAQEIVLPTPDEFNKTMLTDLKNGQTAVYLIADWATAAGLDPHESGPGDVGISGTSISTLADLEKALENIDLENTPLYIRVFSSGLAFAGMLANVCKNRNINLKRIHGAVEFDPIGQLILSGSLPTSLKDIYGEMVSLTVWAEENAPNLRTIGILTHIYGDAGAGIVQEAAFGMATGLEYIREMMDRGLNIDQIAGKMRFSFSVGPNIFMEIAKFRAIRTVWYNIVKKLGGNEESQKIHIHARSSAANKTTLDPYVNLLRTTTESFSAILGGIDSMHVSTFDEPMGNQDEFSRRIARNQQLVLKKEANLERLIDPAGGSWYIESITSELSQKIWALFQEIESRGGMAGAIKMGYPQAEIEKTVKTRLANINKRKDIIVGSNMYANMNEAEYEKNPPDAEEIFKMRAKQIKSRLTTEIIPDFDLMSLFPQSIQVFKNVSIGQYYHSLRGSGAGEKVTPLKHFRLSQHFAELREQMIAYKKINGRAAEVYLANMGSLASYKGRADFSRGFFEVGGFKVIYSPGTEAPEKAVDAAVKSGVRIVVLCSSDKEYPEIVPAFVKAVKAKDPDITVILAGYPKDHIENFIAVGIDEFIHVRADIYGILSKMMQKAGVVK